MVPVGDGSGLMRWAMLSGMLMVRGEICGCTAFTGDSGASRFTFLLLDRAVKVILMLVLGNLKVHLEEENRVRRRRNQATATPRKTWTSSRNLQATNKMAANFQPPGTHKECQQRRRRARGQRGRERRGLPVRSADISAEESLDHQGQEEAAAAPGFRSPDRLEHVAPKSAGASGCGVGMGSPTWTQVTTSLDRLRSKQSHNISTCGHQGAPFQG